MPSPLLFSLVWLALPQDTSKAVGLPAFDDSRFWIVVLVLVVLALLFISVTVWSQRLERTPYHARLYQAFVEDVEFKRLASDLYSKYSANREDYLDSVFKDEDWLKEHPRPEPDAEFKDRRWERSFRRRPYAAGGTRPPGLDPWSAVPTALTQDGFGRSGDPTNRQRTGTGLPSSARPQEELTEDEKRELREWSRYREDMEDWFRDAEREAERRLLKIVTTEARAEAKDRSQDAVTIDFAALRGRGKEFVLEFTAVVVIIFSTVVLGVIGILKDQQIGTLLAAIAGYVLGRATTRSVGAGEAAEAGQSGTPTRRIKDETQQPVGARLRSANAAAGTGQPAQ